MLIQIYSKPNCKECLQAQYLCVDKKKDFSYYEIGVNITKKDLLKKCPKNTQKLPIIFVDNKFVGGFDELNALLNPKDPEEKEK